MKTFALILSVVALFLFSVVLVLAQDPITSTTQSPVITGTIPDNPEFPSGPPELPDELPEDPHELGGLLEWVIFYGLGLLVSVLTDQVKWLTWLTGTQQEFVKKRIAQLGWVIASALVAVFMPLFGMLADLAQSTGVWGVILALMASSFVAYRVNGGLGVVIAFVRGKIEPSSN